LTGFTEPIGFRRRLPYRQPEGRVRSSVFDLSGKVALVTGGSRGIGQAIALGLAEAGADIAVVSRTLADVEKTAAEISRIGRHSLPIATDVGGKANIDDLVTRTLDAFGQIDILVNNAATFTPRAVLEVDEEYWDKCVAIDLKSYFFMCQAVGRAMIQRRAGNIINVVSVNAIRPNVNSGVYAVCKAGVLLMTKALAKEWGPYNIKVNAIAPGVVETDMSRTLRENPARLEQHLQKTPLGRIIQPRELVGAAILLASDAASSLTGQVIAVDGGESI
jgi:NAD(P)-dependent dehydrogenase (short-subunit alcohol dehydrogenase family)